MKVDNGQLVPMEGTQEDKNAAWSEAFAYADSAQLSTDDSSEFATAYENHVTGIWNYYDWPRVGVYFSRWCQENELE